MSYAILNLLLTIIDLYTWIVIISFIMSWLIAFDMINVRSQAIYTVRRFLDAATEPVYEPIRRIVPALGGLDFTPMIVLLGLRFLRDLLVSGFAGQAGG